MFQQNKSKCGLIISSFIQGKITIVHSSQEDKKHSILTGSLQVQKLIQLLKKRNNKGFYYGNSYLNFQWERGGKRVKRNGLKGVKLSSCLKLLSTLRVVEQFNL